MGDRLELGRQAKALSARSPLGGDERHLFGNHHPVDRPFGIDRGQHFEHGRFVIHQGQIDTLWFDLERESPGL